LAKEDPKPKLKPNPASACETCVAAESAGGEFGAVATAVMLVPLPCELVTVRHQLDGLARSGHDSFFVTAVTCSPLPCGFIGLPLTSMLS